LIEDLSILMPFGIDLNTGPFSFHPDAKGVGQNWQAYDFLFMEHR